MTDAELRASAEVVMEGEFLEGREVPRGDDAILLSPAKFRVDTYVKGAGPPEVAVTTAAVGVNAGDSEGIDPRAGEAWRILGDLGPSDVVVTSICNGSTRL